MNNLRIHIIIIISVGLLFSCSESNIARTSKLQQPTKDEAKEALIGLVKSNPKIFPDSVFKDPNDPSSLNILFAEPGHYRSNCVIVRLNEITYEIIKSFEMGNAIEEYYWKGAFIQTPCGWEATMPIEWKEWLEEITETNEIHE